VVHHKWSQRVEESQDPLLEHTVTPISTAPLIKKTSQLRGTPSSSILTVEASHHLVDAPQAAHHPVVENRPQEIRIQTPGQVDNGPRRGRDRHTPTDH
jgi:hypothetical protein